MSSVLECSETAILGRVIRPEAAGWSQEAARAILALGFSDEDRATMSALLDKAGDGGLSERERESLEHYRQVGRLLELMKLRAKKSLGIPSSEKA